MCGIVGMVDFSKKGFYLRDKELFQEMLITNSIRGAHSTGIFGGKIDGNVDYAKCTGNPYELIYHPDAMEMWNRLISKYKFMVGHGRHATKGAINPANAHPFQVDHITMVHNGTVRQSSLVNVQAHSVDSLAIAHALTKYDAKDVLADIEGAYSLVWHDSKEDRLYLAHNNQRPLAIGYNEKEDRMLFASEYGMLKYIGGRNGFVFDELMNIPIDEIWSFDAHSMKPEKEKIPFKKYLPPAQTYDTQAPVTHGKIVAITSQSTKMKLKVGETVLLELTEIVPLKQDNLFQCFGTAYGTPEAEVSFIWQGKEEILHQNKMWRAEVTSIVNSSQAKVKEGILFYIYTKEAAVSDLVETYDGSIMSKEEFTDATATGCSCCKKLLVLEKPEDVFISDGYVLCSTCADEFFDDQGVAA